MTKNGCHFEAARVGACDGRRWEILYDYARRTIVWRRRFLLTPQHIPSQFVRNDKIF